MKNITALTVLVIMFFAVSARISGAEQEKKYDFSFALHSGFVYGQITELVYPTETKGELLSELLWDMKPVFYLGAKADLGLRDVMSKPGFFASLNFKAGIPADSGITENRDWMSIENGELTHFSSHTNKTKEFWQLDAEAGVSFPVKSYFYIKPFLNFSWMHFSFTARGGYGIRARERVIWSNTYFSIDDNPLTYDYSGEDVLKYRQNWLLISPGFYAGTNYFIPFYFNLSFKISPLTYCTAVDEHLTRSRETIFKDSTGFGLFIEPALNVSFIVKRFEFSLDFAYRRISKTKGKTAIQQNNIIINEEDEAGAALSLMDTSILFKIQF